MHGVIAHTLVGWLLGGSTGSLHATAEREHMSPAGTHRCPGPPARCPSPARLSRSPTSNRDSHISFQRCYRNDRKEQKTIPPDPIIVDLVTEDMNERIPEIFPNLLREDAFPTVRKGGYDKRQVDDFVVRNHNQLRDLQERLARAHDELEQLRRELAEAKAKAAVKPEHEQISERLANILRIAEEEASDKRAQVDKEVKEIRAKAEEEAKAKIKSAQEQADRIVNGARDEAKELLTSTKKEAERLREEAAKEAERKLNEAEARANKIHEVADRRLKRLVATHGRRCAVSTTCAIRWRNSSRPKPRPVRWTPGLSALTSTGAPGRNRRPRLLRSSRLPSHPRPGVQPKPSAPLPLTTSPLLG